MFQKVGASAYRKDLHNIIQLCDILGNPQRDLKFIHVAGTNGKGSVTHIIASILQEQGYKVGVFVSPHYVDYRERIKINGKLIGKKFITRFVTSNIKKFKTINASFFEITNAMAFEYFKEEKVDYVVLETGMGGRLDSTNIVTPLVSVITNISFDHQQFLGDTLPLIAGEKAGIIKPGIPVVIGETQKETKPVFVKKARETKSAISFADSSGKRAKNQESRTKNPRTDLQGTFQEKNLNTALATIKVLQQSGIEISEKAIKKGLKHVASNTSFIGRWMVVNSKPLTIFDSAHNEGGLKELTKGISGLKFNKLHFVYGTVGDKDITANLSSLPKKAIYYFCKADIPRALDAEQLKEHAAKFKLYGTVYPSVRKALKAAQKQAGKNDLIMVAGSVFVVAEVLNKRKR
jgi:dihydrofolate synthase/folylpolyglutamate synthase